MKKYFKKYMLILFRGWIGSILVALLIATSFKSAIADWYIVPTGSMKPTIVEGDYIFTNKLAYDLRVPYTTIRIASWDDPKRGDIVVLISPADGKRLIKRVVGIPGDHISMQDNRLFINGAAVQYESLDQKEFETVVSDMNSDYQFYTENLTGIKHKVRWLLS
jgi:signal peptidase I